MIAQLLTFFDHLRQDLTHGFRGLGRNPGYCIIVILTLALGIGAIIGAGIFATIGTAAAGDALRPGAGPALSLSFVLTAVVCGFPAPCYAESASLVPGNSFITSCWRTISTKGRYTESYQCVAASSRGTSD